MRNTRKTNEEFINEARIIHGDRYDYNLVKYVTSKVKVSILCSIHGVFEQTPDSHLNMKCNCPKCVNNVKLTTKEFITRAKETHGDRYNYSLTDYVNDNYKVNVTCLKHGLFKVKAGNHLRGDNCSKCTRNKKLTLNEFINKSNITHNNKYNYSRSEYINNSTKLIITCPLHDEFKQNPNNHLNGNGCPKCKESKGERKIRIFLEENNIKYVSQKRFNDCRDKLPLPFDFYLVDYDICIEYNGRQHYLPIDIWGGEKGLIGIISRDKIKTEYCKNNNIPLITIKYTDNNLNKLKKMIPIT